MKEILVVVDMQNDFVTGALGGADAQAILPEVRKKISEARNAGTTVVFTRDTHGKDYFSTREGKNLPVLHCVEGTEGWEIVEGLYAEGEKIFDKPTFGSVALAEFIRDGGYERAEFIGVCTDICVVSNVLLAKAYSPETEIAADAACCAGTSEENHSAALRTMRSCQIVTENA